MSNEADRATLVVAFTMSYTLVRLVSYCVLALKLGAGVVYAGDAAPSVSTPVPGAVAYASAVKVTPLLKTRVDAAGRRLAYPTDGPAEITAILVEVSSGGRTGWHKHPLPCVGYMLEGELHVTLINGRMNVFRAGEALAETVDLEHEGVNPGPGVAKLVMFVLGTEGQAFTVKTPAPKTVPTP